MGKGEGAERHHLAQEKIRLGGIKVTLDRRSGRGPLRREAQGLTG